MEIRNTLNTNLGIEKTNYTEQTLKYNNKNNQEVKVELKDSIELSSDENIINTKKAYDALCAVQKEITDSGDKQYSYQVELIFVMGAMKSDGISVPSFTSDNDKSYVEFIDEVKKYASEKTMKGELTVSDRFLDFCDLYKQKLIEYGCK